MSPLGPEVTDYMWSIVRDRHDGIPRDDRLPYIDVLDLPISPSVIDSSNAILDHIKELEPTAPVASFSAELARRLDPYRDEDEDDDRDLPNVIFAIQLDHGLSPRFFDFLIPVFDYIFDMERDAPIGALADQLAFRFKDSRDRNAGVDIPIVYYVDIVFVERLRTAKVLDQDLLSELDGLIDMRGSPVGIYEDAMSIVHRISNILYQNRHAGNTGYMGRVMTRLVNEVAELADGVFDFDLDDYEGEDNDEHFWGAYYIIAVGVLICLRVSFVNALGFDELPPFNLQGVTLCKSTLSSFCFNAVLILFRF